jgi:hypothetical protein
MTSVSSENSLSQFHEALDRADDAVKSILDGKSHELDLAALRASLAEARVTLAETCSPLETAQGELSLLRKDLADRILTMTRATNVALDKRHPGEEADLAKEVALAPATELLQLYRRACVQFRDTFPGNSRYLGAESPALKDWSEFKSI